jgi:predicted DNA-binding transcriptional regulator AlpA
VAVPGSIEGEIKQTKMSSNIRINKVCEFCNAPFIAQQYKTRFCSHRCNQKSYKRKLRDQLRAAARENYIAQQKDDLLGDTKKVQSVTVQKLLITIDELSTVSGISSRTLFRLLKEQAFPKIKIGRRLLFDKHHVLDYLNHKYGNVCEENLEKENLRKVG